MKKIGSIVALCFGTLQLMAQHDSHAVYWTRYQHQFIFSPTLSWSNEIDNRRFFTPNVQNQLIYHSRVHYRRGRWDYGTGLTLSWAFASRPENPVKHATFEVRPVAEVSYEIPKKNWLLQQRLRIDNRFFEEDRFATIFDDVAYTLRLRYRIQTRINLWKDNEGEVKSVLRLADEIMVNHRQNLFDQNRVYVSIDLLMHKNWSLETGYIYIYQQRAGTDHFLHRHVLRFSLLHRMYL